MTTVVVKYQLWASRLPGTCAVATHPHCRLEREGGLGRFHGRPWGTQPTSEPVCDSTVQGFPTRQSTSLSPLALTLLSAMKPATLSHLAQPVPRGSRSLTEGLGFLHRLVIALSDAQSSFSFPSLWLWGSSEGDFLCGIVSLFLSDLEDYHVKCQ